MGPGANTPANCLACGTFKEGIELWDLDVMHSIAPVAELGGRNEPDVIELADIADKLEAARAKKNKAKKKRLKQQMKEAFKGRLRDGSHSSSVMSLDWHAAQPTVLASGSADGALKTWDLPTTRCTQTLTHHTGKVQTIQWHPVEPNVIITGSFDKRVCVLDVRSPAKVREFYIGSELEQVRWNPHNPALFACTTESGMLVYHDVRHCGKGPLLSSKVHQGAATGLTFNRKVPGFLATCSEDETVKLWSLRDDSKLAPLGEQNLKAGRLFSLDFSPADDPFLLCAGGSTGQLAIWDTLSVPVVRKQFGVHATADLKLYEEPALSSEPSTS